MKIQVRWWAAYGLLLPALLASAQAPDAGRREPLVVPYGRASDGAVPSWAESFRDIWLKAKKNGSLQLSTRLSATEAPVGQSELFVIATVTAPTYPAGTPPPMNLGIVIDHSQSMRGARLVAAKKVARELVSLLGEADRASIIRCSTEIDTFQSVPLTEANRKKLLEFLDDTHAEGASDLSVGFDAVVEEISPYLDKYQANRLVLISDGRLTHGMNDPAGLAQIAKRVRESKHLHISTVAIGEDADQELMAGIAKEGWGFTEYISDATRDPRIGERLKIEGTRRAAEELELVLKLPENVTLVDVLEHDEVRAGSLVRVRLYEIGSGETMRVMFRLSVNAAAAGPLQAGTLELAYRDLLTDSDRSAAARFTVQVSKPSGKKPALREDPEVIQQYVKAQVAQNLVLAQGLFEEGESARTGELLDETERFLNQRRDVAGPRAFAEELAQVQKAQDRIGVKKPVQPAAAKGKGKGKR